MNRRHLLKLIASGLVGHALDLDKLLWVPSTKTIFIPSVTRLTTAEIVTAELERLQPIIRSLFERDNLFYATLTREQINVIGRKVGR